MIRISIITITFNAARSLQRTLDSVACQSWPHIEHFIIDGASKDDTVAIAQRYKAQSPHQVLITSEPDKGLYDAMNKGLQRATGDYIVYLNAGDTLHAPDTIETVVSAINSQNITDKSQKPAVVYGDTAITDDDGRFLHLRTHRPPEKLTWRSFKKGMLVCHQAFYARLDIARRFPYNLQYRHSADVDWCIRIMKEADRLGLPLVNTHAVLADFEEGGDTTQHHRASLLERYHVMSTHYGSIQTFLLHCWFVVRAVFQRLLKL
ncbi:MAG: glycosyltransferase [Prevotella sp.]|nr:glycosyltransferase [Prevotella sp.]